MYFTSGVGGIPRNLPQVHRSEYTGAIAFMVPEFVYCLYYTRESLSIPSKAFLVSPTCHPTFPFVIIYW